ncbi:MAG TPA: hypothetical protein GX722_10845 [Clostridiales bacterium]|nr:hypothetical protein [Clostridiales bacterium]
MYLRNQRAVNRSQSAPAGRRLVALVALLLACLIALPVMAEDDPFPKVSQVSFPDHPAPFVPILTKPVPAEYFYDAVLVGDSLSEGFRLSNALPDITVLAKIGQSAGGIMTTRSYKLDGKKVKLQEYLHSLNPGKIYLWVGSNGIDQFKVSHIVPQYAKMLDMLVTEFPDTVIYCMSLAPIIESRARKQYPNYTNKKIVEFNKELVRLAGERNCYYLGVHEVLVDEKGALKSAFSAGDGIHMKQEGYQQVAEYLMRNALTK